MIVIRKFLVVGCTDSRKLIFMNDLTEFFVNKMGGTSKGGDLG